ncbi:MAG: multiheme c-type cytochrome [Polyangiaceae bacterium]
MIERRGFPWLARAIVTLVSMGSLACGSEEGPTPKRLSRDQLMDPQTCEHCHPLHYQEWSGSMHAYAAEDPVFIAMNARGQRETGGALGSFCVGCHAPLAVREGLTSDGLNLAEVPKHLQGVTCYFCHNVESVDGSHNAELTLAGDRTMRGPLKDPSESRAHGSKYSPHFDRRSADGAALCGTCHDIVVPSPPAPAEVHLERTFAEWKESIFSHEGSFTSCSSCHMTQVPNSVVADAPGVGVRPFRSRHDFPGVDLALTSFPRAAEQRDLVQQALDVTLRAELCVAELPGSFVVQLLLDNVGAGHRFPSGAAHDRRAWVELRAFAGSDALLESGVVADGEAAAKLADPNLLLFRDGAFDADGKEVHQFWEVASTNNDCTDAIPGCTIPGPVTLDKTDPQYFATHSVARYPRQGAATGTPDRVTLRVRMRPIGLEVLDALVASGDLDASIRDAMPTHDLLPNRGNESVTLEWTPAAAQDPIYGFQQSLEGLGVARCVGNAPR